MTVEEFFKDWLDTDDLVFYDTYDGQYICARTYKECVDFAQNFLFKQYKGKVAINNKRVLVLDWYDKGGYTENDIHYMLDKKTGVFTMCGDHYLEEGLANFHQNLTIDELLNIMHNKWWFIDHIENKQVALLHDDFWDECDFNAEIKRACENKKNPIEEVKKDMENLKRLYARHGKAVAYHSDFKYLSAKYHFKKIPSEWGQRVNPLVYFWVIGFYMACKNTKLTG